MLNLFQADLFISAFMEILLRHHSKLVDIDLYDNVEDKIKNTLQDSANQARDAISLAQKKLNRKKASLIELLKGFS